MSDRTAPLTGPTLDDVISMMAPGEKVSYLDLIDRLKAVGRPVAGIGHVVGQVEFRGYANRLRNSEVVSWREPYFDESSGDWTEGMLWLTRRGSESVMNDSNVTTSVVDGPLCMNGVHYFASPSTPRKWPYEGQPCTCDEVKWEAKP